MASELCMNCFSVKGQYEVCPFCGYVEGTKPKQPHYLTPGTILANHFIVGNAIGFGGFGITYKCFDTTLGVVVAVKEFYPAGLVNRAPGECSVGLLSGDKQNQYQAQLKRFLMEAQSIAQFGKAKDIVTTSDACVALMEDGSLRIWGKANKSEKEIPEMDGEIVSMFAGRYHITALTDKGTVYSWGSNAKHQTDVPKKAKDVTAIYGGTYQNYAVTKSGDIVTWGLKGYLFGSDELGRDVFTRILNGGRMTMTIGAISVIISTIIGIIVGGVSGFFGGWVDIVLQRITEIVACLPFLPMAMILTSIIGNSMTESARIALIMVILGILSWPSLARLVRAQVLAEREQEFVTAANAMGVKRSVIVFKHIIPNVISVIIVSATLDFAYCMLTESTLSFLGFGVKLPRPTWGNMLNGCVSSVVIQNYWWRWVFPAIMLGICVICINMVGDGLRDAIDPKSNER